jgi:hypothetical protein
MTKNYLQLEFSTGLFFKYSKNEEQGYEKHVSTKGNTSYRKYYKEGITGVLESVSSYDIENTIKKVLQECWNQCPFMRGLLGIKSQ